MIFQLKTYFGAVINGEIPYSLAVSMDDCRKFPEKPFDEEKFIVTLKNKIESDGYDPSLFTYRWLTAEEYEGRMPSNTVEKRFKRAR